MSNRRTNQVHWVPPKDFKNGIPEMVLCGASTFSTFTKSQERVTCKRCLVQLGRILPQEKSEEKKV